MIFIFYKSLTIFLNLESINYNIGTRIYTTNDVQSCISVLLCLLLIIIKSIYKGYNRTLQVWVFGTVRKSNWGILFQITELNQISISSVR